MLAAAWLGMKNVADDAILTPYNEDYSEDSTNMLDKAFVLELTRLNVISKATALELLMKRGRCLKTSTRLPRPTRWRKVC